VFINGEFAMRTAMLESHLLNPSRMLCMASIAALALVGASRALAQDAAPAAPPAGEQADPAAEAPITPEQIAKLEKMLSGATLVGQFTVNGRGESRLSPERYELSSVKHMKGDMWLVTARIKYGDHDLTVPLPLPIRWAGDTPVITLDKFTVPGMGAWSARVMFYDGRYMGYWSSAENPDHGGYLFGKIEPPRPDGEGVATPVEPAQ
jgi:hypothetical protein